MSKLKAELSEKIKTSMKSGDKATLLYARSLFAAIRKREIDERKDVTDEDFQKIVGTQMKQRRESISQFEKGGRDDLVAKEKAELTFLEGFMPPALGDDELVKIIDEAIDEVKPSGPKEMGKVMQALMPKVQGRADGKKVSQLVREKISGATS